MEKLIIPFGDNKIKVTPTEELKTMLDEIQKQNGRPEYIPELLKLSSKYNYYDATGNDSKAGAILVNLAGTEHHDRILKVAKELMNCPEYKKVYNEVRKSSEPMRIERGKQKFSNMLSNNGITESIDKLNEELLVILEANELSNLEAFIKEHGEYTDAKNEYNGQSGYNITYKDVEMRVLTHWWDSTNGTWKESIIQKKYNDDVILVNLIKAKITLLVNLTTKHIMTDGGYFLKGAGSIRIDREIKNLSMTGIFDTIIECNDQLILDIDKQANIAFEKYKKEKEERIKREEQARLKEIQEITNSLGEETVNILNDLKDNGYKDFILSKSTDYEYDYSETTNDIFNAGGYADNGHVWNYFKLDDWYDENEIQLGTFDGDDTYEDVYSDPGAWDGLGYRNMEIEFKGVITLLTNVMNNGKTVEQFIKEKYPNSELADLF